MLIHVFQHTELSGHLCSLYERNISINNHQYKCGQCVSGRIYMGRKKRPI